MSDGLCQSCAFLKPQFDHQGRERLSGICRNIFSRKLEQEVWPFQSCGEHSAFFDMTLDADYLIDHPCRR